jgi:hypothetical protein
VRWAVWYGAILPVDGIWRSTGLGALLSPAEADAAAALVFDAATEVVLRMDGQDDTGPPGRMGKPLAFGRADPQGVLVDQNGPGDDGSARVNGKVAGAAVPRILAEVYRYRAAFPGPRNTEDEPLCLIRARLVPTHPDRLVAQLVHRPDFERHPADPSLIGWLYTPFPGMTEVVRGTLRIRESSHGGRGAVVAEVNSRERWGALRSVVTGLDSGLVIEREKEIDPVLHTAWPLDLGMSELGDFPTAGGWERNWINMAVPALDGQTPRQASRSDGYAPVVETLLRQFEYQAGVLALAGKAGADTGWLRRELGLGELGIHALARR